MARTALGKFKKTKFFKYLKAKRLLPLRDALKLWIAREPLLQSIPAEIMRKKRRAGQDKYN
ncbi:MAG: hypothetical protein A3C71_01595 [Candidatus Yanofskybacteria bacterium RIFCSPHIGHO2_02_FULL_43_15c]|uniref:Uncharacterized protein n=2 Tax=Candidatus Yanofskyibacteriota TaxID=1752733 RepID=A0A1F8H3H1_9BACT|nr:MAG: hypothetical protein A3C71_01595 [Candidatus Yanofskybacteria bacterium RIFCSPHIGHO2_02_FULL_43_15c]OGN31558.1 MAG: hypothetical protein A3I92_01430 [Candidatus Yanofskybacteria bacterium RIFCSPLOWO2_02_FULL_43_10b]